MLMPRDAVPLLQDPTVAHGLFDSAADGQRGDTVVTISRDIATRAQTMSFARPRDEKQLGAIDFASAEDHPARGEYPGAL